MPGFPSASNLTSDGKGRRARMCAMMELLGGARKGGAPSERSRGEEESRTEEGGEKDLFGCDTQVDGVESLCIA